LPVGDASVHRRGCQRARTDPSRSRPFTWRGKLVDGRSVVALAPSIMLPPTHTEAPESSDQGPVLSLVEVKRLSSVGRASHSW
jgi:hypothetical protein